MLQAGNVPKKSLKDLRAKGRVNLSAILLSGIWAEPQGYYAPLTLVRSSLTLTPDSLPKSRKTLQRKKKIAPGLDIVGFIGASRQLPY
jgi:hypothetical protein